MDCERSDQARAGGGASTYSAPCQDEPAIHPPPSSSSHQPSLSSHHSTVVSNRKRSQEPEASGRNSTKKLKTQSGTSCSSEDEMQLPGMGVGAQLLSSSERECGPIYSPCQPLVAGKVPIQHHPNPPPSTSSDRPSYSLTSRELTELDLPVLLTVLGNDAYCTEQLGYKLLAPGLVRTLQHEANGDLAAFLSKVLTVRLQVLPALTVQELADALSRPPINRQALAQKLQQHFLKQPVVCSTAMQHFSDFLDAVYKNDPILHCSKGEPTPTNKYINLAVIRKEDITRAEADESTKTILCGGIDQIVKKKKGIELYDVFKPEDSQEDMRFVLAEGGPGVGKSTMAWELCRRRQELQVTKGFSAVVFLPLREKEVQDAKSLEDLIRFVYHAKPNYQEAIIKEIESSQGEDILLVLDGFDEVPVSFRNTFFLAEVIRGKQLPKATVLLTSRPSARADLLKLRKPHKHIEVLGFTPELVEQYATSVFGSNQQLLADFLTYISTNPVIKSMMYVPLNSAIVVEMYQENTQVGRPIPQTMTQLYSELVLTCMWRDLKATGDTLADSLPDKLEDVNENHPDTYSQLLSLAKLAFDGTVKQEVIFDNFPASHSTLGLMTTSQKLCMRNKISTRHSFFHLTVQEFLSAFYISQLPSGLQRETFQRHSDQNIFSHMDVVWKFLAGLTGFRDIGWELFLLRKWATEEGEEEDDDDEDEEMEMDTEVEEEAEEEEEEEEEEMMVNPVIVQCLYEAQEKVEFEAVLGRSKVVYTSLSCSAVFDCFAIGYCVAASRCTWTVGLNVGYSESGADLVEMLVLGLKSKKEVCGSIDELNLSGNKLGQKGLARLGEIPRTVLQQLSYLDVSQCGVDDPALDQLSNIIPTMTSLEHLNISDNPAENLNNGLVKLLQALANAKSLTSLTVSGCGVNGQALDRLSNIIPTMISLEYLDISQNPAENGGLVKFLQTLANAKFLTTLNISRIPMDRDDITALSNLILPSGSLKELTIGGYGFEPECTELLLEMVFSPSSLEDLGLVWIDLPMSSSFALLKTNRNIQRLQWAPQFSQNMGFCGLCEALCVNTSLETLNIGTVYCGFGGPYGGACNVDQAVAKCLSNVLRDNQSLKEMHCCLFMGSEQVQTIVDALQFNETLEVLELPLPLSFDQEFLGSLIARSLSNALKVNRTLKVLKVGSVAKMGPEDVQTVVNALEYNQTLEVLELPRKFKHFSKQDQRIQPMYSYH